MTILTVELLSEKGTATRKGRTYERVYGVTFSGGYNTATLNKTTDIRLPQPGQLHPDDYWSRVETCEPALAENEGGAATGTGYAIYTVRYAPIPLVGGQPNQEDDPFLRPPEIHGGGGIAIRKVMYKDLDGKPIQNSVGDLYHPLPNAPVRGLHWTITRNERINPSEAAKLFSYTVNEGSWYGAGPGTMYLDEIGFDYHVETIAGNAVGYWRASYPVQYCETSWRLEADDNGFREVVDPHRVYDPAHPELPVGYTWPRRQIVDDVGHPIHIPSLLDGFGHKMRPGLPPVVYPRGGFKIIKSSDWGALALPNPFLGP